MHKPSIGLLKENIASTPLYNKNHNRLNFNNDVVKALKISPRL
jgi:hypothetical protein